MPEAAAALALILALVFPASGEPAAYESVVAAEAAAAESTTGVELDAEQAELMAGDPDWRASARLYHAGGGGATGNDSLGCRPIPPVMGLNMRTLSIAEAGRFDGCPPAWESAAN